MDRARSGALLLLLLLVAVARTAPVHAEDPSLEELLAEARATTGATEENALLRVIVSEARCESPAGSYEQVISSAHGGNLWFRQKHPGQVSFIALVSPEGSWNLVQDGRRRPLPPKVNLMVRSHDHQRIALDPESFAHDLRLDGNEEFQGVDCLKLSGLTGDGTGVEFFFARDDHRPVGYRLLNPFDAFDPVNIFFKEWRLVEGVRLPCVVVAKDTQGEHVFDYHTIYFEDVQPDEE